MKQISLELTTKESFIEVALLHYTVEQLQEKYTLIFETILNNEMGWVDLAAIELNSGSQVILQYYHHYYRLGVKSIDIKVRIDLPSYKAVFNDFLNEMGIAMNKTEWLIDEEGYKSFIKSLGLS